jgi:LDH2 family malate/lactate/ureidoglycolate dehydrogenase
VKATLSAAVHGRATLGFPHLVDYLNGFMDGRIKCDPTPRLERCFPAFLACDADGGVAQLGFELALDDLVGATKTYGVAVFTQHNSFTTGELGYYVRTLANEGIIALAATNAYAMVATKPGDRAVYSTNPLAFGFPLGPKSQPLIIDQASSATAFVNIFRAAEIRRSRKGGRSMSKANPRRTRR